MSLKDYENVESSKIEFKEFLEMSKPKNWLKSVSAFANSNGGIILYDVRMLIENPLE